MILWLGFFLGMGVTFAVISARTRQLQLRQLAAGLATVNFFAAAAALVGLVLR